MKQHKCDYCDSAFYRRRDKEKHLLKTHNIDLIKNDHNQSDLHTLQTVPTAVTQWTKIKNSVLKIAIYLLKAQNIDLIKNDNQPNLLWNLPSMKIWYAEYTYAKCSL